MRFTFGQIPPEQAKAMDDAMKKVVSDLRLALSQVKDLFAKKGSSALRVTREGVTQRLKNWEVMINSLDELRPGVISGEVKVGIQGWLDIAKDISSGLTSEVVTVEKNQISRIATRAIEDFPVALFEISKEVIKTAEKVGKEVVGLTKWIVPAAIVVSLAYMFGPRLRQVKAKRRESALAS